MTTWLMTLAGFHANDSSFTARRISAIRAKLARGETVYLAGLGLPGTHNSGVALVEVTQAHGPRLIVNNEEERFSGDKHTTQYPRAALDALRGTLQEMGRDIADIDAWLTSWDYPDLLGTLVRSVVEEFPESLKLLRTRNSVSFDARRLEQMTRSPKLLRKQFGLASRVPLLMMPHHDNHAWFSFAASPFPDDEPVAIAVLDGTGDLGSVSTYVAQRGTMQKLFCNDSVFDSLGAFYSVISSTQGGWTWLSSEGRYMGAAAWGDMDRATNPYYARLKAVLDFGADGAIRLNRAMGNWYCDPFDHPYKQPLIDILGEPLRPDQLWNPDAVLRVEDIQHRPDTQDRLDKAAATQLVFEDAMIHVVDHLLRATGARRLVLTGGVALNALGNMRLLEHFNAAWFAKAQKRDATLHLWVPPTPGDPGVTVGAAWMFAHLLGAPRGAPMSHAFYCGAAPAHNDVTAALEADDIASMPVGDISTPDGLRDVADLMAFMVAQSGIIALYQGAAETGPRALGHRSILANPCDPLTRERLNERVKYREAIRPLAPMATLEAALEYFELQDGASDANYNAYNYMVLTAHAKAHARKTIPAVIHADGTGRIQIVCEEDDPLTHAYLKALGRHIGVELSVNTSFNVAGPIAQTPAQAVDTLRRSKGLDVVILVADDGTAFAAWHGGERDSGRFTSWLEEWKRARP
ncbi:carbamoyltransferase [Rhodopseudomonas sp. P2A-2r]|uniref:carbamoyltransferase C-terminal domain-containing protein n=1 Tax=Rhodopseudomonas sp. P2A-2r TaxID=2991972 RepID=UPI002234BFC2|nr:carbamoyltransferase C-terminal domain-containing protein [Rhodopseudomonas sp. P2A-2r]UZE46726.1 carbamoyltransferase [Rhodopseudomonas sp. P2A-2r]